MDKLKEYIKTQTDLRIETEKQITKQTTTNIGKIIKEGGVKSKRFWQRKEGASKQNKSQL